MNSTSLISVSVLASLALAASAPAATVSPAGVRSPQLAVNASGATVVAWERLTKNGIAIEVRSGRSPGTLGATRRLAGLGVRPRVAIGPDGTAAVQWLETGAHSVRTLRVAVARPGKAFGRGQLLDRRQANILPVALAVQPGGRVVAVWQRSGSRLGFALAPRNHAFGKAQDLAAIAAPAAGTIPVDPRDGSVVVAYRTLPTLNPPANSQTAVRTLARSATTFAAPVVLTPGAGSNAFTETYPAMVSGPGGTGVAFASTGEGAALTLVRRAADGSWTAPQRIGSANYGANTYGIGLYATLPIDGSAVAAWTIDHQYPNGTGNSISRQTAASTALPAAAFGPLQALTPDTQKFGVPAVASAGGEAFVATARPHGNLLLATRPAGGAGLPASTVLDSAVDGDIVLAAAGAHVLAAYQKGDRLRLTVVR